MGKPLKRRAGQRHGELSALEVTLPMLTRRLGGCAPSASICKAKLVSRAWRLAEEGMPARDYLHWRSERHAAEMALQCCVNTRITGRTAKAETDTRKGPPTGRCTKGAAVQ